MNRYLICSADESVTHLNPQVVLAETPDMAVQKYLKVVYSKNQAFRDTVLDLAVNLTFVEQFYLSTEQEQDRFHETGVVGTEEEIVKARVRAFFESRPDLGERFVSYMETEDRSLINDELFEFIATKEMAEKHGLVAFNLDSMLLTAI